MKEEPSVTTLNWVVRDLAEKVIDADLMSWVCMYKGKSRSSAWPRHTEREV